MPRGMKMLAGSIEFWGVGTTTLVARESELPVNWRHFVTIIARVTHCGLCGGTVKPMTDER